MALPKHAIEAFINSVASYPWLYDPVHASYKDTGKRKNSWQQLAHDFHLEENGQVTGTYTCIPVDWYQNINTVCFMMRKCNCPTDDYMFTSGFSAPAIVKKKLDSPVTETLKIVQQRPQDTAENAHEDNGASLTI